MSHWHLLTHALPTPSDCLVMDILRGGISWRVNRKCASDASLWRLNSLGWYLSDSLSYFLLSAKILDSVKIELVLLGFLRVLGFFGFSQ